MSQALSDARDVLQITEYANGYSAVDMLRAQVASLMAEVSTATEALERIEAARLHDFVDEREMIAVLRGIARDALGRP